MQVPFASLTDPIEQPSLHHEQLFLPEEQFWQLESAQEVQKF